MKNIQQNETQQSSLSGVSTQNNQLTTAQPSPSGQEDQASKAELQTDQSESKLTADLRSNIRRFIQTKRKSEDNEQQSSAKHRKT